MWIFTLCSFVGLVAETIVSYPIDGMWKDRAGMVWGPFSPIYGVGGVLMTISLRRVASMRLGVLFGTAALVGAGFEYVAGWFWQAAFGIVAWDYSDQPFNLGGHTCLGIAIVWGLAGVAWMKIGLPVALHTSDAFPHAWRRPVAWALVAFFVADAAVTMVAFDCWMGRLAGKAPDGAVQQFFAQWFGNDFMNARFQTMSLYPQLASR